MPGLTVPLRRSRSIVESERDADRIRGESRPSTAGSDAVKRPRLNGQLNGSRNASSAPSSSDESVQEEDVDSNLHAQMDDDSEAETSEFHAGAIVRVKVTDFVTYQNAEFFPGPNLNMVIGPNGTGKSSLVCAICLGLGWGPQHLGRAQNLSDFVRHGMKEAFVETELQGDAGGDNHIIRLRIIKDTNGREWWLNNKKCNLRAVQALMRRLNIQIDNLCQFLPQDKVSEFAALSPIDLLHQTLRAAAPEHMIESHDKLKELRKSQKTLQSSKSEDQEKLDNLEVRQQNLRAEVDKVRKRKEIQDKIKLLEKAIVFVEYNIARALHNELKAKAQATEQKLKELERRIEPLMRSVNEKQEYQQQIEVVIKERKRALQHAERAADQALEKIQILEKNIAGNEADITSRKQNDAKRKADVNDLQKKIREIDARLANPPPEFNASTWNERIREKGASRNPLRAEQAQLGEADRLLIEQGTRVLNARKEAEQELASLESQAGQQASKIGKFSVDVQKAWKWVQEHMDEFEKEVYGPPMITCSIKDPRYLDQLEAVVGRNSLLTITTQTSADNRKLAIKLKELGLLKVRYVRATGNIERKPMWTDQQLKENGLDVWAFDLIDGPDPVLDMIFSGRNRTPLGLKDISEEQLERMQKSSIRFIAGRTFYTTTYRPEYDAGSTSTRGIKNAFMWTDAPVDKAASRELERKIQELSTEFERMQAEVRPHRVRMGAIKEEIETIGKEVEELNQSKAAEQKLRGQYNALPTRKEQFQENLASRKREGEQVQQQMREVRAEWDKNVIEKAEVGLQYKDLVAQIRTCHEELLDAEVRRIEAISDVDALKEKNAENARKLDEGKRAAAEARRLSDIEKGKARRSLEAVKILLAEAQEDGTDHYFQVECADKTIDGIQNEMAAEKAKLELIHASNPNAIRDFEERQRQLDKLQEKMARVEEELGNVDTEITEVRGQWEPELDKLVLEISEAFAFNFERIGCNGEVGIRKEEDFDLWAIEIRVKFRENETLQILDAHRQSGGERSVSTIFYLMALQSLAKSPFRVVDEINQGMDPRNERMVHERMVEIACQEHTSQYFLITPKLLTGLRYDRRMKVLCIASGEYMPKDYKSLNVSKIIGMRRAVLAAR